MDAHRVRRVAEILVSSQLRSGRSSSDPKSWTGRGYVIAVADILAFLGAFGATLAVLRPLRFAPGELARALGTAAPFVPLVAVATALVAGVMFELTATAKFAGSDAANWLPITPTEFVTASSAAVAYSYSPPIALFLGGLMAIALVGGAFGTFLLTAGLAVVALYEGGVLVEMVRAVSQRAGPGASGRRGQLALLFRAALLVILILAFDLAFNPVFLLAFLQQFSSYEIVTTLVPVFWSTQALVFWASGARAAGLAFAVGQLAFVGLLVYLAGRLRLRFWVPMPSEIRIAAPAPQGGHPLLTALGLSRPEAALVSKDFKGFVRRREMLPTLVVPIVLIVLMAVEGSVIGLLGSVIWVGWVGGFFSLLLAVTSVGQERHSLQSLFAYPIRAGTIARAKATSVLIPGLLGTVAMAVVVGVLFGFAAGPLLGLVLLTSAGSVVLALWGLVFAARYSDFQERPRPQYLRPGAMLAALGSGMVVLFMILVPGAFLLFTSGGTVALVLGVWVSLFSLAVAALSVHWTRTGFDQLFQELPF